MGGRRLSANNGSKRYDGALGQFGRRSSSGVELMRPKKMPLANRPALNAEKNCGQTMIYS